jgi:hypothetical protein
MTILFGSAWVCEQLRSELYLRHGLDNSCGRNIMLSQWNLLYMTKLFGIFVPFSIPISVAERKRNEDATHAKICRTGQKSPQAGKSFV